MGPSGVVAHDSGPGMDDVVRAAAVCYGKASKTSLTRIDDNHIDVQCNASQPKPSTDEAKIKQMSDCDYSILKPATGDFSQENRASVLRTGEGGNTPNKIPARLAPCGDFVWQEILRR